MLFNYLAPLFETLFIFDTYSCREEKGTLFGVERYQHHLRSVTNNFTQEAWVLYLDLSGYFYFTFAKGFSKAIQRPQFGGKPVPYEWYDPPLFKKHKMIIRNQPTGFYCRYDAQTPTCRRRKLS